MRLSKRHLARLSETSNKAYLIYNIKQQKRGGGCMTYFDKDYDEGFMLDVLLGMDKVAFESYMEFLEEEADKEEGK